MKEKEKKKEKIMNMMLIQNLLMVILWKIVKSSTTSKLEIEKKEFSKKYVGKNDNQSYANVDNKIINEYYDNDNMKDDAAFKSTKYLSISSIPYFHWANFIFDFISQSTKSCSANL